MIDCMYKYWIIIFCLLLTLGCRPAGAKNVERIVSLGPINTENVFLLGAGDRLVANTRYCVRPEAAKHKEKIGSVIHISVEKIISLQPDLVLATAFTRPEQIRQLEAAGIKVVQFRQPASFAEICSHFLSLGHLLALEEKAKQIVSQAEAEVAEIEHETSFLPKEKVFLQVGSRPLFGSVPTSFTNDYIVLAGGINIIADQKTGLTNYEKVISQNPDVIIIAVMGSENGIAAEEKKKWQHTFIIKAAQEKRIYVIEPNMVCSPSPVTFVQALRVIAGLIHPAINVGVTSP